MFWNLLNRFLFFAASPEASDEELAAQLAYHNALYKTAVPIMFGLITGRLSPFFLSCVHFLKESESISMNIFSVISRPEEILAIFFNHVVNWHVIYWKKMNLAGVTWYNLGFVYTWRFVAHFCQRHFWSFWCILTSCVNSTIAIHLTHLKTVRETVEKT